VNRISAGHRVGVHLHGIKVDDVQRGDTLVAADYPYRSRSVNVELELLNGSTFRWKPGLRAHFLAASFEMECRIWGLVRSNGKIRAQLQLPQEACFYPDQRFILRSTNPLKTIGGGIVVDVAPDRPRRVTEPEQDRGRYLELSRPAVFKVASLARKWMCEEEEITGDELRRSAGLVWHTKLDLLAVGKLNELIAKAKDQTAEWSFSMLAGMLKIKTEFMHDYLRQLLESHFKGVLSLTSSSLRFDPRRGELSDPEQSVAENVVRKLLAARLQPLRVTEYLTAAAVDKKTFDKALARLLKDGRVIRIDNEFVVERSIWEEFKKHVQGHAAAGFTASEFGKEFGLSRKYSVPYLECLNRFGVLRRQGDRHMILRARRET
jgi:selenocysteine-specific elongation factor